MTSTRSKMKKDQIYSSRRRNNAKKEYLISVLDNEENNEDIVKEGINLRNTLTSQLERGAH